MSTLRQLTEYLTTLPFVERDHFESTQVNESTLEHVFRCVDDAQQVYLLYREYYDGVLYFEAWNQPKELILSHIAAWILEHGGRRDEHDLGFPQVEPLRTDEDTFDLMITIRFMEEVLITPDERGDLLIGGQLYRRLTDYVPDAVESIEVAI